MPPRAKKPVVPRTPELDAEVNEYLDRKAEYEKLGDDIKQRAAYLVGVLPPGSRYELMDGVGVEVTNGTQAFDPAKAKVVLSAEQIKAATVETLSAAEVKKIVSPLVYGACSSERSGPTLKVLS